MTRETQKLLFLLNFQVIVTSVVQGPYLEKLPLRWVATQPPLAGYQWLLICILVSWLPALGRPTSSPTWGTAALSFLRAIAPSHQPQGPPFLHSCLVFPTVRFTSLCNVPASQLLSCSLWTINSSSTNDYWLIDWLIDTVSTWEQVWTSSSIKVHLCSSFCFCPSQLGLP